MMPATARFAAQPPLFPNYQLPEPAPAPVQKVDPLPGLNLPGRPRLPWIRSLGTFILPALLLSIAMGLAAYLGATLLSAISSWVSTSPLWIGAACAGYTFLGMIAASCAMLALRQFRTQWIGSTLLPPDPLRA